MAEKWDIVDAHSELIGRVVFSWNEVQWMLYQLFKEFSGMETQKAQDVVFSLKSDANQRDIVLAVGKRQSRAADHIRLLSRSERRADQGQLFTCASPRPRQRFHIARARLSRRHRSGLFTW